MFYFCDKEIKNATIMRKLVRSKDKVLGGVCAGFAEFLRWDKRGLRIIWFLLSLIGVGSPVIFYFLLWMLMPDSVSSKKSYEERMKERLRKD